MPELLTNPVEQLTATDKRRRFAELLKAGYKVAEICIKLDMPSATGWRWKAILSKENIKAAKTPDIIANNDGDKGGDLSASASTKPPDAVEQILAGAVEGAARLYAELASGTSEADSTARQAAEKLLKSRGYLVDEGREVASIYEGMASGDLAARLGAASKAVLGQLVAIAKPSIISVEAPLPTVYDAGDVAGTAD